MINYTYNPGKPLIKGVFYKFNKASWTFMVLGIFFFIITIAENSRVNQIETKNYGFTIERYMITNEDARESAAIGLTSTILFFGLMLLFYFMYNKCQILVTDTWIIGKTNFGKPVNIIFDQVVTVELYGKDCVIVATALEKIKFHKCRNAQQVCNAIIRRKYELQNTQPAQSTQEN